MDERIQPDRLAETFAALVAIDSPSYGERQMADQPPLRPGPDGGRGRRGGDFGPDKGNPPLRGAECLCIFIFQRCDIRFKKARAHLSDQIIQRKSGTGKRIGCHHNPRLI